MIKDKWIYQDTDAPTPWAIYAVKAYERGQTFGECEMDITFYSEQIDNSDHMLSFIGWHEDTMSAYVERICRIVRGFGGRFDSLDSEKVERELCKLFFG